MVRNYFHILTMEEISDPDFKKMHIKFNKPQYVVEYVKNEMNGYLQNLKKARNIKNEHHYNWMEGVCSQEIQKILSYKVEC